MPKNRCHCESSDESSVESSKECECRHCEKKKRKQCCKNRHTSCSQKNNRCYKKNKCSSSRNYQTVTDYCKNDCKDGKVILISIS